MPEGWRAPEQHHHTLDVNVNIVGGTGSSTDLSALVAKLNQLIALATTQGAQMSVLSDAVDALVARVSEDTQHLLDLLAAANAQVLASAANDAADAAAIADLQAQVDAATADAQATADRINSIDPVADFPAVEPPA